MSNVLAQTCSRIEIETLDDVSSETVDGMAKKLEEKYQASPQRQAYVFITALFALYS